MTSVVRGFDFVLDYMEANMTAWKCNKCGNTISADSPPEICPFCREKCEYVDVTCYIPECGGPVSGNINPDVFKKKGDPDK
jgi:ABC-type ATPase with predicted acetyltransferase domain